MLEVRAQDGVAGSETTPASDSAGATPFELSQRSVRERVVSAAPRRGAPHWRLGLATLVAIGVVLTSLYWAGLFAAP
jgi:hypothetical protein